MNGCNMKAEAPERVPYYREATSNLEQRISNMENAVSSLAEKLKLIMRPDETETAAIGVGKASVSHSEATWNILGFTERVDATIRTIYDIMDRLEI